MTKAEARRKESVVLIVAIALMTLKIALGLALFERWRLRQLRLGRVIAIDDELE